MGRGRKRKRKRRNGSSDNDAVSENKENGNRQNGNGRANLALGGEQCVALRRRQRRIRHRLLIGWFRFGISSDSVGKCVRTNVPLNLLRSFSCRVKRNDEQTKRDPTKFDSAARLLDLCSESTLVRPSSCARADANSIGRLNQSSEKKQNARKTMQEKNNASAPKVTET